MKNAIAAEIAATSFSFFAMPIATPIANIIGRFPNTMSPAALITCKMAFNAVPGPIMPIKPYVSNIVSFVNEPPTPSNKPATGRIAIGSINDLPTRCNTPKILSFTTIPPKIFLEIFCILPPFSVRSLQSYHSQKTRFQVGRYFDLE